MSYHMHKGFLVQQYISLQLPPLKSSPVNQIKGYQGIMSPRRIYILFSLMMLILLYRLLDQRWDQLRQVPQLMHTVWQLYMEYRFLLLDPPPETKFNNSKQSYEH